MPSEISKCMTNKEINSINKEFINLFRQGIHLKYLAQSMGYQIRKIFIEKGYKPAKAAQVDIIVSDEDIEFIKAD
jgi:predicted regulator of amino acid metabolism with ACT domain